MTATDLASIRQQLGLSQADVAALAGVNKSTVSRYERGETAPRVPAGTKVSLALQRILADDQR